MFDAAVGGLRRRAVTTPGWLVRHLAAVLLLTALAAVACTLVAGAMRDAAVTVGRDAEPSVALALRIEGLLGDMDAAAMDDALDNAGAAVGTSLAFHAASDRLSDDVVAASRNITYGDAEQVPLQRLVKALGTYREALVVARTMGAGVPWIAARRVEWASRVNREFAAPEARALADANASVLEERYAAYRRTSLPLAGLGVAACAALAAYLVAVQVWLARRVRRLLNPALIAAMLLAAFAGLWLGSAALAEREVLRAAKADSYDSLSALFQAKTAVNRLRADMSDWLLAPDRRAELQRALRDGTVALAGDEGLSRTVLDRLEAALLREQQGDLAGAAAATPPVGGLLGRELANITYGAAERQAMTQAMRRLAEAQGWIARTQAALSGRGPAGAGAPDASFVVARWTARDGAAGTFAALQDALDAAVRVNEEQFARQVDQAVGGAGRLPFVICGALLLSAVLSAGGLWLRLREYL